MNVSWASDPHIRVISEGSCDTGEYIHIHKENSFTLVFAGFTVFLIK